MAAHTIQDALDSSVAGDLILVTNGVYATGWRAVYGSMPNRVVVPAGVEVRSVNGPAVTVIAGESAASGVDPGAIRCVYVGTNAVLSRSEERRVGKECRSR